MASGIFPRSGERGRRRDACIIVRVPALRMLVLVAVTAAAAPGSRAATQESAATGITGQVLAPDGSPVTSGNVALVTSSTNRVISAIDRHGQFRILPDTPGWQQFFIAVPGHTPYHARITVPTSRIMALPAITLQPATYYHARFVTADGEPLAVAALRRRSIDSGGLTIADPLGHVRDQVEPDGSLTIGPLPMGRLLLAFDRTPLAITRLPDVNVTGKPARMERGTITIQPGGRLEVDVLDEAGSPLPNHGVSIEDATQPSPMFFQPARTDERGRAVFDRLGPGRYRVSTQTVQRCANQFLTITRPATSGGSGTTRMRLVVGGRVSLRIVTGLGALPNRPVSVSPDPPPQPQWQQRYAEPVPARRLSPPTPSTTGPGCGGMTDAEGRMTLAPFPPGSAQVRVGLFNSSYIGRVSVPDNGAEILIKIPDGLTPVRVTDRTTREPVGAARLTWLGGGGRVEAVTSANGDALLEAVGVEGGTLTIEAREYGTLEGQFDETPDTQQEVALMPVPSTNVTVRVVNGDGQPVAGAVVAVQPRSPGDAAEFAATSDTGVATFLDVEPGSLPLSASAPRFATAALTVPEDGRGAIVITLAPAPREWED